MRRGEGADSKKICLRPEKAAQASDSAACVEPIRRQDHVKLVAAKKLRPAVALETGICVVAAEGLLLSVAQNLNS